MQPGHILQGYPCPHGILRGTIDCTQKRENRGQPYEEAAVSDRHRWTFCLRSLMSTFTFSSQEEMGVLIGESKEEISSGSNGNGEDTIMLDSSELSDVSEGGSESTSAAGGKKSSRQKDLRLKAHTIAHSKEREAARAKQASQKQAMAEHRRLDEEVNKLERRLESIEREFRKLLGGVRVKPLGRDRFYNRIWWFDGMGSASLVGSGGIALYGTGRLFIQGPSEFDLQQLEKKTLEDAEDITARRKEEEGEEGMLGPQDWAVYTELEEVGPLDFLEKKKIPD